MKKRATSGMALMVGAALLVSACGSGGSASTASTARTKNAALDGAASVETAACASGVVGPNGGKVLGVVNDSIVEIGREGKVFNFRTVSLSFSNSAQWVKDYQLNGIGGWTLASIDVLQAVKDSLWSEFKSIPYYYWSSSASTVLMPDGTAGPKPVDYVETMAVPFKLTPVATAVCSVPTTTTTSSTTTSTTTTTTSTTTTTVAPSTTVALSATKCTDESDCQIGNTGPGGGIVVATYEVRNSSSVGIAYVELAPRGWDGPQDPMFGQASQVVSRLSTLNAAGGKADWRAPTEDEFRLICRTPVTPPYASTQACLDGLGFGGVDYGNNKNNKYWTYEKVTVRYPQSSAYRFFNVSSGGPDYGDLTPRLRPVRVWTRQTVSLTTVPTTLPPSTTTTTLAPVVAWSASPSLTCSDLSQCDVGERGPAGGLIIDAQRDSSGAAYVEMAPDGWAGTADRRDPLVDAASATQQLAKFNLTGGEWVLPSEAWIASICHVAGGRRPSSSSACTNNGRIASAFGGAVATDAAYWKGRGSSVDGTTNFGTGRNSGDTSVKAYLRPVRVVRYVTPTTTTTIPKTCAQGGVCKIGDISPTGGLIVDFSGSGSSMTYTEMASKDWRKTIEPQTSGEPALPLAETKSFVNVLAQRTSAPWKLPTDRQMRAAFLFFAGNPTFGPDCTAKFSSWRPLTSEQQKFSFGSLSYWIEAAGRVNRFDNFNIATGAAYYDVGADMKYSGRPFAERPYRGGGAPTPAVWTTPACEQKVIPTTTTTTVLVPCSGRGLCKIGDVGPNGGVIIGIAYGSVRGDITYTEMRPAASFSADCQQTAIWTGCLGTQYDDWVRYIGRNGVFDDYPTVKELMTLVARPDLRDRLRIRSNWYFSSIFRISKTLTADMALEKGNTAEILASLEINDQTLGLAVDVSTGQQREMNTALFRGVNRWKCQYSCK